MADRSIKDLTPAEQVKSEDMFVLEQDGVAKNLKGNVLKLWLLEMAAGRGGIDRIEKTGSNGLVDIYTIIYANETTSTFNVTNGKSITGIAKVSSADLVDTYRISYNDGSATDFTVTNGATGDKGDNAYVHVKWASQLPTEAYHDMGDIPDDYIGIYSGNLYTAPSDWKQYKWFQYKGEKGDTGDPAQVVSAEVVYQLSENGTTPPAGAWSAIIPTVPQGRFLWTRTTVMFNTGNPVVSYSAVRNGVDGKGSVTTVNGKSPDTTGNVALTASDVGARPDYWMPTAGDVGARPDTWLPSLPEIGAAPAEQLATFVRQNLLDNWYFLDPINQRGVTEVNKSGYGIDRWMKTTGTSMTLLIRPGGLTATGSGASMYMRQFFEDKSRLLGKVITASVLYKNAGLVTTTVDNTDINRKFTATRDGIAFDPCNAAYPLEMLGISIYTDDYAIAAKLEIGSTQTLAHRENGVWVLNELPDHDDQLARCQRYFYKLKDAYITTGYVTGEQLMYMVPILTPVPMRRSANIVFSGTMKMVARKSTGGYTGNFPSSGASPTSIDVYKRDGINLTTRWYAAEQKEPNNSVVSCYVTAGLEISADL